MKGKSSKNAMRAKFIVQNVQRAEMGKYYTKIQEAAVSDAEEGINYDDNDLEEWKSWNEKNATSHHGKAKKRDRKNEENATPPLLRKMDPHFMAIKGRTLGSARGGMAPPPSEHEIKTPAKAEKHQKGMRAKAAGNRFRWRLLTLQHLYKNEKCLKLKETHPDAVEDVRNVLLEFGYNVDS
jgi:hypothetical protein